MLLQQRCDGPNGSTVTNANCTSPNQFDTVGITGLGAALTFSNTRTIHDNLASIQFHMPNTSSATEYGRWTASVGGSFANIYMRSWWYFSAIPTVNMRLMTFHTGAGLASCGVQFATGGKLRTINNTGTVITNSANNIPLNQWVRIEFECVGISGGNGAVNSRFYSGANLEGTLFDTGGSANGSGQAVGGLVNDVRIGTSTAVAMTSTWDAYCSDVMVSDSPLGPPPFRGWGIRM